ncbi:MAG: crossover junction endodeoxyribonuclease RuvC [Rikenellaceae bacterium]
MDRNKNIIIGIDPGSNKMGYGIISVFGKKIEFVAMGYIDLSKFDTHALKLKHIYERVSGLVNEYKPDAVAFEAPFFGENVQSMLKLGRAQGVAIAAAASYTSEIFEYSPTKVKIAVAGNGRATKEQVANMLKSTLGLEELPKNLDSTDGLAVAMCHYYQTMSSFSKSNSKSWGDFVKQNPERIK